MLKKFLVLLERIIISVLLIYAYNKLSLPLNIIIPINLITIFLVTLFGIPSILFLILFSLLCI